MILIILVIIVAIIGAPLFAIIAALALINFANSGSSIIIIPQEISELTTMPLLHSIPLFTFAGYLLAKSQASMRMVRLTRAALGWMPGGLALVTLIVCSLFTAFTGATGVTIVALGGLLLPALLTEKYGEKYSLGLITTSGSFGLLFPPSLPVIIFGVVAATSIDKLYIAGIIPGVLLITILGIHAITMAVKNKIPRNPFTWNELGKALWAIKWEILLPVIVFAGIYSGFFTISDAAVITVVYLFIVEVFITRDVKVKDIPKIIRESMLLVGAILVILSVSLAATNYIIDAQIPQKLFELMQNFITNKWMFLLFLNVFLLVVGCIMDVFSAIVVIVPLILPIAEAYNINLVHLGIVFLVNLQIGYLTPPVGMNLFIASIRFNKSVIVLYKSVILFIGLLFGALMLITYIPALSTWFIEKPTLIGRWEYKDDNGNIDQIQFKTGNQYLRKKGNAIDIMMNEPYYGKYQSHQNRLTLINSEGQDVYHYEIYNSGNKLLLKKVNNVSDSINISSNNNAEEKRGLFYKNLLAPPLGVNTAQFIGKWQTDQGETLEFYFNGLLQWIKTDRSYTEYRYQIINKNKIKLIENTENTQKEIENIYKYKFNDSLHFYMYNKNVAINLSSIDSSSDL